MLIEFRQALISYQDYHMLLLNQVRADVMAWLDVERMDAGAFLDDEMYVDCRRLSYHHCRMLVVINHLQRGAPPLNSYRDEHMFDLSSCHCGRRYSGVKNAAVVVAFVDDRYAQSVNCLKEARFAMDLAKPIVCVLMPGHADIQACYAGPAGSTCQELMQSATFTVDWSDGPSTRPVSRPALS